MTTVRVGRTRFDSRTAVTELTIGAERHELLFHTRQPLPRHPHFGDVWLPIALFPAMRLGLPLELADPVSTGLLRRVRDAQEILTSWYPDLTRVEVAAPSRRPRLTAQHRTLQAFTGGVDSFYSALRGDDLDALVYLHDLHHDVHAVRDRMTGHLTGIAEALGLPIIHVEYRVRHMLDRYAEWGTQTHGAVLGALAAFIVRGSADFRIPATHSFADMPIRRGSHAALDPLWGSEARRIVHHGADLGRFEKIRAIVDMPIALENLRVCFSTTTEINCSACEKCVRTMIPLDLLGALERARTFRGPITEELLDGLALTENTLVHLRANQRAAVSSGNERLARLLGMVLSEVDSGTRSLEPPDDPLGGPSD